MQKNELKNLLILSLFIFFFQLLAKADPTEDTARIS